MTRPADPLLDAVRHVDPAPASSLAECHLSPEAQRLLAEILATPRDACSGRATGRTLLPPGPRVGAAVAALVAAAIAVVIGTDGGRPAYAVTPPPLTMHAPGSVPARPLLLELAARAARQPAAAGGGRFDYVSYQSWGLSSAVTRAATTSAAVPTLVQRWTTTDGSGRLVEQRGHAEVERVGSRVTYRAVTVGQDHTAVTVFGADGGAKIPLVDLAALSPVPKVLAAQLISNAADSISYQPGQSPAWFQRLRNIIDLHRQQVLPPALHAAMLRVIADTVPGLVVEGPVTDRIGRGAVAVSFDSAYGGRPARYFLVLDPTSGALLGYEEVVTTEVIDPHTGRDYLNVRIPAVLEYTAFLASARVAVEGELPPG